LDFLSFKEAFYIFENKEHLKEEGINKLYLLKKGMNSERDFSRFDVYTPSHTVQSNVNYIPLSGHYINGFIAEDGCLTLITGNNHFGSVHLSISQHINNRPLIESIANYFYPSIKVHLGRYRDVRIQLRSNLL